MIYQLQEFTSHSHAPCKIMQPKIYTHLITTNGSSRFWNNSTVYILYCLSYPPINFNVSPFLSRYYYVSSHTSTPFSRRKITAQNMAACGCRTKHQQRCTQIELFILHYMDIWLIIGFSLQFGVMTALLMRAGASFHAPSICHIIGDIHAGRPHHQLVLIQCHNCVSTLDICPHFTQYGLLKQHGSLNEK